VKIASLIVEFDENRGEEIKQALHPFKNLTIYGEKDNKIVVVIESEEIKDLTQTIDQISAITFIKSVTPVYISEL